MITLDTSALYALLNRRDGSHAAAVEVLEGDPEQMTGVRFDVEGLVRAAGAAWLKG